MSQPPVKSGECGWCGATEVRVLKSTYRKGSGVRWTCPQCLRYSNLERRYGLTRERFEAMLEEQAGNCAICGRHVSTLPGKRKTTPPILYVDHCHRTGKVRGLLCNECNTAVGVLDECPERTRALLKYLADRC